MNVIPVLGIPFYNRPELLSRCVASIDHPVDRLVIVDNSPSGLSYSLEGDYAPHCRRLVVIRHPNAGVAASWNEIITLFPAPWWFLVNNDIQFAPGDLGKMAAHLEAALADPFDRLACAYGNHGASAWAVTALGVREVGLFDCNIFPAYLEDCDWAYRADLAEVKRENVPGCQMIHGEATAAHDTSKGSCTVNANGVLANLNARTHAGNFEYYRAKWGGENGREKFKTPFNQPGHPVWAWRFLPAFRHKQQW